MAVEKEVVVGAIEAGGTKFVCAVGTGPGDVRAIERFETTTPAETISRAVEFLQLQRREHCVFSVGIGSFGPIDPRTDSPTWGFITTTPKPGWRNAEFAPLVAQALGVPVAFDTDVNAAALAEGRWGVARGLRDYLYLTVGTGIGGGAVVGGRLLHGLAHPEMGHIRVNRDRARDPFEGVCPYHGDCWEGLASGTAMKARWGRPAEQLPMEHEGWALEAHYLAQGLMNLVLTLAPERVILGGGIPHHPHLHALVGAELLRLLGGYFEHRALTDDVERYIVAPELGDRAGVLGAMALGLHAAGEE